MSTYLLDGRLAAGLPISYGHGLGQYAQRVLVLALTLVGGSACVPRQPPADAPATPLATLERYRHALMREDPKAAYALLTRAAQQALPYEQFAEQWQQTRVERTAQAAELDRLLRDHDRLASLGTPARSPEPAPTRSPEAAPGNSPGKSPDRSPNNSADQASDRSSAAGASPAVGAVAPALRARAVVTLPQGSQLVMAPAAPDHFLAGRSSAWRILDPDLQIIRAQTPEAVLRLLLAAAEQRNYTALLRLLTRAERQSLEAELTERIERLRAALARGQSREQPIETSGERTRVQYDPRFFIDLKREQDGWRIADFN